MSRQADNPKSNIDLKQPLIHIYRNAPEPFDKRRPVPVLCFIKEKESKFIAADGKIATCKICISLAAGQIEDLSARATFAPTDRLKNYCMTRKAEILKLIPKVFTA